MPEPARAPLAAAELAAIEQRITRLCLLLSAWEAAGTIAAGADLARRLDTDSTALVSEIRRLQAEPAD